MLEIWDRLAEADTTGYTNIFLNQNISFEWSKDGLKQGQPFTDRIFTLIDQRRFNQIRGLCIEIVCIGNRDWFGCDEKEGEKYYLILHMVFNDSIGISMI